MSNKRHTEAILTGFEGPFFPPLIDELGAALDATEAYGGGLIEKVGRAVANSMARVVEIAWPATSDGYEWFRSLTVVEGSGSIVVLIPWMQDWDKKDGTQRDRSPAVYTQSVEEGAVAQVLREMVEAFRAAREPADANTKDRETPAP